MSSAFSHLADLIDRARKADGAPRQAQQDREAARAQSRQDIRDGRRMFLEQQARQTAEADPEAAYLRHCKTVALAICNAGRRARGEPPLKRLMQDESPEYPDDTNPNKTDDTTGDDRPNPPNKGKKKTVKKKIEDQSDDEDAEEPVDEGDGDFDTNDDKKKRDKAAALLILNAGRRAKGLPLLTLQDML